MCSFTCPHLCKSEQTQKFGSRCRSPYVKSNSQTLELKPFPVRGSTHCNVSKHLQHIKKAGRPRYSQYCKCMCSSHIHMLHALQVLTCKSIMFILVLSNTHNEAEGMGSRISVGSAADIVKLTHYKWICNPRVDLNCVYCYSRTVRVCVCLCMHAYLSVSTQLHLFLSLTLLSILLFDHMPLISALTEAQCFPYKRNGIIGDLQKVQLFLSCTLGWGNLQWQYSATETHPHMCNTHSHKVLGLCLRKAKLLWGWGGALKPSPVD